VFDTNGVLTGGVDPITAGAITTVAMSTGSKTVAHNALIAVVIEMTARGGADSVSPTRLEAGGANQAGLPYTTADTGAGPAKGTASLPFCLVEADDGAVGVLTNPFTVPFVGTNTSFNSSSNPDEHCLNFQVTAKVTISRLGAQLGELDAGETGNLRLYTDPQGTPVSVASVAVDPDVFAQSGANVGWGWWNITPYELQPNTAYCIAYEATTTANRIIRRVTSIPTANIRKLSPFGTTMSGGGRQDGTGAFSTSTTDWPMLGFWVSKLDDGAGGAGGGSRGFGMTGGMA
jgi:hypothetical protein